MSDIITFEGFSFQYAGSNKVALHDIDFNITKGEITVLVGASGSGKTTLLKCIKEEIAPVGLQSGSIIRQIPSSDICMVFQNPEVQLVCGSVRYDLVFHMENLGIPREVMKRRLAETCCYFGIEPLLHKKPEELSGGQKQLIALCAALMVQPTLLLLDEPLSQLDPLATLEFLDLLKRINQEFGVTILMSEHRLSDCIGIADTIAIMDKGEMVEFGETRRVLENIWKNKQEHLFMHIPEITRASLMLMDKPLLTPRELICSLKKDISYKWKPYKDKDLECKAGSCESKEVENKLMCISMKEIIFSYPSSDSYVLRRFTASLWRRGINCLIGGNGSGKSTLLKIIAGIQKGYMGKLSLSSQSVGYLPQNINSFFSSDTVYNEITFLGYDHDYYLYLMNELKILDLEQRHPFDVSGGEAVRICIAAILLRRPKFILLDEPTRGLDSYLKDILASLLNDSGAVIFMATNDLEFAARYGKRCFMLFDGELTLEEEPHIFFKNNHYYTTSISKGFRHVCADLVTMEDVRNL